jgi:hypothetical protein
MGYLTKTILVKNKNGDMIQISIEVWIDRAITSVGDLIYLTLTMLGRQKIIQLSRTIITELSSFEKRTNIEKPKIYKSSGNDFGRTDSNRV